jgi:hypothetical protein
MPKRNACSNHTIFHAIAPLSRGCLVVTAVMEKPCRNHLHVWSLTFTGRA